MYIDIVTPMLRATKRLQDSMMSDQSPKAHQSYSFREVLNFYLKNCPLLLFNNHWEI